jgi:hypothetical protein
LQGTFFPFFGDHILCLLGVCLILSLGPNTIPNPLDAILNAAKEPTATTIDWRSLFMAGKNTAAFGIYQTHADVEYAVDLLKAEGFRNTDVSVLFPENQGSKDFAVQKNTKAPEGTATGATTGAVAGGALGWLAGIGALAIPGVGPLIAAGPIVAALTGVGVGGAIGGIAGALIGMGIPEYEAKRYEGRIKDGGILLSVHCDDSNWTRKAKNILERTGATDVASTGESRADWQRTVKPMPRAS